MNIINLTTNTVIELPEPIIRFYGAYLAMVAALNHPRHKFTLDGRLLGDIGEYLVEVHYGMIATDLRTAGVDGLTSDRKKTVQVKVTQSPTLGPAFSFGEGYADHLIALWLDFPGKYAHVLYNGPEEPVRKHLPLDFKGTKRVKRHIVTALNEEVREEDRMPRLR